MGLPLELMLGILKKWKGQSLHVFFIVHRVIPSSAQLLSCWFRQLMPVPARYKQLQAWFWSGLPIIAKVKPVYQRVDENELLQNCFHGKTQNQSDSFNGLIWQRVPKEVLVGKDLLELVFFDAVAISTWEAKVCSSCMRLLASNEELILWKAAKQLTRTAFVTLCVPWAGDVKEEKKGAEEEKKGRMTRTKIQNDLPMGLDNFDDFSELFVR